jgi:hypothetical protein
MGAGAPAAAGARGGRLMGGPDFRSHDVWARAFAVLLAILYGGLFWWMAAPVRAFLAK